MNGGLVFTNRVSVYTSAIYIIYPYSYILMCTTVNIGLSHYDYRVQCISRMCY